MSWKCNDVETVSEPERCGIRAPRPGKTLMADLSAGIAVKWPFCLKNNCREVQPI
jgi:hypothetical protein